MKLWVDDIRNAPDNDWIIAQNINEAIRVLQKVEVTEISLDHDISHQVTVGKQSRPFPCDECFCAVAYYIALCWEDIGSPKITIHTANPVGAGKMKDFLNQKGVRNEIKMLEAVNRLEMKAE